MKKQIREFVAIVLTLCYGFAISSANNLHNYANLSESHLTPQEKVIYETSNILFSHTTQAEISINNSNNLPSTNNNSHTSDYWIICCANEKLFESEFSQYTFFARNILFKYRKADIIFPFHYFW
jgi:hypothetical protein